MMISSRAIDLEKIMRVPWVDPELGFDIHPDGNQIAFSWNITGQWEVFLAFLDSSTPPRQITTDEGAKFDPHWSPDGKTLAYVIDLDGGENYDIYLYDLSSRIHTNLTPDTPSAITTDFCWSPDGKQIAFCCDESGQFDTYIIPTAGGEARLVFKIPYPDFSVYWSPSGTHLAIECEAAGQDYWTYLVDLETSQASAISINNEPISAKDACWSADGKQILFCSNHLGNYQIALFNLENQEIEWLTDGEGEKEHPDWSPEGKTIAYVTSIGPNCSLSIQTLFEEDVKHWQIEPGVVYAPTFTPDGEHIVFVFDNPRHPDDLWSFSVKTGKFTQLTQSIPDDLDRARFVMPKEITYPGLDGVEVPALLYLPQEMAEPAPAVVNVHGGPNWLSQITWDPFTQHMVSQGWAVLAPNYRGSTGYGKEWQLASRFELGGIDTEDVVAGANYLEAQKIAIPDKIAVTGRSWGGYLTMTCLTQYPDRWAAGSASVPFLNWFTSHENSREDLQHWDRENFGDPEKDYDLWYERSPFFFLDRINAPVQLLCGENDVRCPASESLQATEELRKLGKEVDYVVFEGEGHALLKVDTQVKAKKKRVEFLAMTINSENTKENNMLTKAKAIQDKMVDWRRDFHMHPELGFQEVRTAAKVAEVLESIGCRVQTGVGKTGVVGELGEGKPIIGIRADMDALPIQEANDVPYKSTVDGAMHACGHDAHTSILLGAATMLSQEQFPGTVRFFFQPSEEWEDEEGVSGAPRMIEDGAMEDVDAVIALHVYSALETGDIQLGEGNSAAGVDTFYGTVIGTGGHGSTPHKVVDPIFLSGYVILALNSIISRRLDPFDEAVISIGTIQGGTTDNVIPERVELTGTIRFLTKDVQKKLHEEIKRAFEVAKSMGGDYELKIVEGFPPMENEATIVKLLDEAAADVIGREHIKEPEQGMGSEDFGFFIQKAPGAMFNLGCKMEDFERRHHDPKFDVHDDCLPIGAAIFTEAAIRFLKQHKK
jgi:amidohydrolase